MIMMAIHLYGVHLEIVKTLIEAHVDLHRTTSEEDIALSVALVEDHTGVVKFLQN